MVCPTFVNSLTVKSVIMLHICLLLQLLAFKDASQG